MTAVARLTRPTVAVIGAGIAGLAAARALRDADLRVAVFEKSRGLGGRLATRRPFGRADALGLDHGAPYAEGPSIGAPAAGWDRLGRAWAAAPAGARIGAPGLSDLVRPLAEGLRIETGVEITEIAEANAPPYDWMLIDAEGDRRGPFDALVSAIPAPQAARLLGDAAPETAAAEMHPVWTLLAVFDAPLAAPSTSILRPETGLLRLIAHDSAKPERATGRDAWIAHADPAWSAKHLEREKPEMASLLAAALAEALGQGLPEPAYLAAHRWRYAETTRPVGQAFRMSEDGRLGVCGDWRLGRTAGDGHRSGALLGAAMARKLTSRA